MFAVPGWNISAKSLVQEQAKPVNGKSAKVSTSTSVNQVSQSDSGNLRKRKRKTGSDEGFAGHHNAQSHTKVPKALLDPDESRATDLKYDRDTKKRSKADLDKKGSATDVTPKIVAPTDAKNAKGDHDALPKAKAKHEVKRSSGSATAKPLPKHTTRDVNANAPSLPPIPPAPKHLTPLQAKMRAKLTSARFRHLNETLYTTSSADALALFADSPDLFTEYHAGFSQQVKESWPQNPVEKYIKLIKSRGVLSSPVDELQPLPRRKPGRCKIIDLGCGDAPLARGLEKTTKKLSLTLYSYDLHAPNSHVTVADISALPLHDGEVDVGIFCLSLMGTNWLSFVEEVWRVLRGDGKGEIWIAEVKSRFGRISARKVAGKVVENSVGKRRKGAANDHTKADPGNVEDRGFAESEQSTSALTSDDDTDLQPFIDCVQRRGFMLRQGSVDRTNKMFVSMVFTKSGVPRAGKWKGMRWTGKEYQRIADQRPGQHRNQRPDAEDEIDEKEEAKVLKPCVYKQR